MSFTLVQGHERMVLTNLCNGHQIRHTFKIASGEIGIASRLDSRQSLADLCAESPLAIPVLGQFPQSKGKLQSS